VDEVVQSHAKQQFTEVEKAMKRSRMCSLQQLWGPVPSFVTLPFTANSNCGSGLQQLTK